MTPEQVLRTYYENANEINAITARRQPTFEEKVRLAKMVGTYLKQNMMGRQPEGAWFKNRGYGIPGENPERKREEAIYAEPNYNMLSGEIPGPVKGIGSEIRHGIHWSKKLRDTITPPTTSEGINTWSKNDVLRRLHGGTKEFPYVPTSDFYPAGVTKEFAVQHRIPHAIKFMADDIYDLGRDPLNILEEVTKRRLSRPANSQFPDQGNVIAEILKEKGYTGFSAETNTGRAVIRSWESQKAFGPVKTTTDHSTVIESLGNYPQDFQKIAAIGQKEYIGVMEDMEKLRRTRYDSITINYGELSLAKFEGATSGQMEHGFTTSMDGPLPSIRSMMSELGRGAKQHTTILRYDAPAEIANGVTYRFRVKEGLGIEQLNSKLKNVKEYKFIEHKDGSVSIDQFIMEDGSKDDLLGLYREIGTGNIEEVLQKSEVLGDSAWTGKIDVAKENFEKTIGEYFGRQKATEILKEPY